MKYQYDLIVIGGGSAGLSTASIASRLGAKVALIDSGTLGGDCLHYGCIPSKTLIASAKIAHAARTSHEYGVHADNVHTNFADVLHRIHSVIQHIQHHADSPERFRNLGCDVWTETNASFVDPHTILAGETHINAKKIAICAGTRPQSIPLPGLEEAGYYTNESIFTADHRPETLAVIGAGPVGCELAQAMQRLGSTVHLLNRTDHIFGKEDEDIQHVMRDVLTGEGMHLHTGIGMQEVRQQDGKKVIVYERDGQHHEVHVDAILVATGRRSNADSLALENAGVATDERGYIITDKHLRTNVRHIYAAGDITGHLQFTHSAGHEAGVLVSNALLHFPKSINLDSIPRTTFTDPEVASIGLNEAAARQRNVQHTVLKLSLADQDRALAENTTEGFVKVLLDKKDRILGCQIVAPHAGEMIHEWIVARSQGMKIKALADITHVYPTLALSAQQLAGEYMGQKFFTPTLRKWVRRIFGYRNTRIDAK